MNTFIKLLMSGLVSMGILVGVQPNTTDIKITDEKKPISSIQEISLEKAKQIALKKVNGIVQKVVDDHEEYDVYIKKDSYLYKIEVDKSSGKISEVDKEKVKTTQKVSITRNITLNQAKDLALKKVNGKIITTKTDSNEYEIIIQKDNYVYEIEVHKKTGKITDIDKEKVKYTNVISNTKAKQIALSKVSGTVQSVEYDADDCEYSVEIMKDGIEYEVTIHARTGRVQEVEKD